MHTSFDPLQHGFTFPNTFHYTLTLKLSRRAQPLAEMGVFYGLCGGMCFTALDYYFAGLPLPAEYPGPAAERLPILLARQVDSLKRGTLTRVLDWMLQDDAELWARTLQELPAVCRSLDEGRPAVLGLVRSRLGQSPTRNHQVLAVGYECRAALTCLYLYDPNHPGQEPVVTVDEGAGLLAQSSGEALRGLFKIRYTRRSIA